MELSVPKKLKIPLFQAYGVEIEYMVVDRDTLNVLPIADQLFHKITGIYQEEVNRGEITFCNELVLHLIELKTTNPEKTLIGLESKFQQQVRDANHLLATFNGMLMPTAMHPWMDPHAEMKLWPHGNRSLYETFNKIFDCRGHGWSNLQSTHLNLPFATDEEFAKLHAAIRVLLPIMPAIAASSPIIDSRITGFMDTRLEVYRNNSKKIPSITGKVIPEVASSEQDYENHILKPMYQEIAPYDPEKILQYEWLNSRGAIARFDRHSIEIRVLDVQECPLADLAILQMISEVLKSLASGSLSSTEQQNQIDTDQLQTLLLDSMKKGERQLISNREYLELFGLKRDSYTAQEIWQELYQNLFKSSMEKLPEINKAINLILNEGPLARRILKTAKGDHDFKKIYRQLCEGLEAGQLFKG